MTVKDILFGVSKSTIVTPNNWIKILPRNYASYSGGKIKFDTSGNLYSPGFYTNRSDESSYIAILRKVNATGLGIWYATADYNSTSPNYVRKFSDVVLDSLDNIYLVGIENYSACTTIISKYNSSGVFQWEYKISGSSNISSVGVYIFTYLTIDSAGNPIVTYQEANSPTFVFLKISSSGTLVWSKSITLAGLIARGVYCDSSDNIYITGRANSVAPATGSNDIITMKCTSAGALIWARKFGHTTATTFYPEGINVITDSSGNVYTLAWNYNTSSAAILKYNSNGTQQWVRTIAGFSIRPENISIDSANYIYICGGTVIAKYDSAGTLQWQRTLDVVNIRSCSIDTSGGLCLAGYYAATYNQVFIARMPSDGTKIGSYTVGTQSFNYSAGSKTTATSLPYTDAALSVTIATDARFSLVAPAAVTRQTIVSDSGTNLTI